ncbi:MAG: redoxin domain-containing protein [Deltaproteobacteria bacterium]|nr:redoxin domain-containing protein [Deltaproteobacteria bacterium]
MYAERSLASATATVTALIALVIAPAAALAEKTQLDPGEEALPFRIRVLNADKAKIPTFDIQDAIGPEATVKKKMVLMSFFATYCEPCKKELPFLGALYNEFKEQGLQIVSVSIDKEEDKIKVATELATQHDLQYPVLTDRFQVVAKRYFISKLPCLYFIDANMKVAKVSIGYDDNAQKEILATVRTALGLPTDAPVPESLQKFMHTPAAPTPPPAVAKDDKTEKTDKVDKSDKPDPKDKKTKTKLSSKTKGK